MRGMAGPKAKEGITKEGACEKNTESLRFPIEEVTVNGDIFIIMTT